MRKPRYMTGRTVVADDATVLNIIPIFPGETVRYLKADCYTVSLSDADVSNPNEMNWFGIGIPWGHVLTTTAIAKRTFGVDMDTVATWDSLYEQMLLDTSEDGNEYYGGDFHAGDTEELAQDEDMASASDEELIDSGPVGPYQWFGREVLSRTHVAAGNSTTRGGDEFRGSIGGRIRKLSQGQILMFGMVRHEVAATTNFGMELDSTEAIETNGLLMMGDYEKVKALVRSDSGNVGNFIRTTLYGGDNYIEGSTIIAQDVKAYSKLQVGITGPLDRDNA